jgi:hypothetical protein
VLGLFVICRENEMKIREVDRRKNKHDEARDGLSRLDQLARDKRFLLDRLQRAWDQGFACAVDMLARGATLEQMRDKIRRPQEVPVLARGTRDFDLDDTQPITVEGVERQEIDDYISTDGTATGATKKVYR